VKTYKVEVEFEEGTNGYRIPRTGRDILLIESYTFSGVEKILDEKYGKGDYVIISCDPTTKDGKFYI